MSEQQVENPVETKKAPERDFQAQVDEIGPCKVLLRITVPAEVVKKSVDKEYDSLKRKARLKGFRQGKAPRKLLEKLYGNDVESYVQNSLIERSLKESLEDAELSLLRQAEPADIKFSVSLGLSYEATLTLRPKIDLPNYREEPVKVEIERLKVSDEEVNARLDAMINAESKYEAVSTDAGDEVVVEDGDQVVCDVEVWLASELEAWDALDDEEETDLAPLDERENEEILVNSNAGSQLVAGIVLRNLSDDLMGLHVDGSADIDVLLPRDYPITEGRGESAMVRLEILEIQRKKVQGASAETAKALGYDSLDDMRSAARNAVLSEKESERDSNLLDAIVKAMLQRLGDIALPADVLQAEVDKLRQQEVENYREMGMSPEQIAKELQDKDDELIVKGMNELKRFFLLDALAKHENIVVTERELEAVVLDAARNSGMPVQQFFEILEQTGQIHALRWSMQEKRVLETMREKYTEVAEVS